MRAGSYCSSVRRISSVCWPRAGAGVRFGAAPWVLTGEPSSRRTPKRGCLTSTIMSRAATCSSASASAIVFTGAHGTLPRRRDSHSDVVRSAKRALRIGTSTDLWASRSANVAKRGSRATSGRSIACTRLVQNFSLLQKDDDEAVARGEILRGHDGLVGGVVEARGLPVAVVRSD